VANHKSAVKRYRQSRKRRTANRSSKSRLSSMVRDFEAVVASGDKKQAQASLRDVSQALAKAASNGLVHASMAARKTSRLSRRVAALKG
jgi:small subunit ribosomal protein S20